MRLSDTLDLMTAKLVEADKRDINAAGTPYAKIASKADARLQKQLSKYESGKTTKNQFLRKTQSILSNAYDKAFKKGSGQKNISSRGKAWLSQFKDGQFKYLQGFANAIEDGSTVMGTSQRMGMYANSIKSSYWSGSVVGSGRSSMFNWYTTPGENCDDCLELESGSPYTRDDLPTVPGAGDTRCGSNCNCRIALD